MRALMVATSSSVRTTATTYHTNRPCMGVVPAADTSRYMVLPWHAAPYTVLFTQPTGRDSV